MKRFFLITAWEFLHRLRSRSFLVATFVMPLLLIAIVVIPSLYYEQAQARQDQVIGCVELDTSAYSQILSERLANAFTPGSSFPRVILEPIVLDTTGRMRVDYQQLNALKRDLDSLNEAYNKIKERRTYLFQRPDSQSKEKLLSESYEEMIYTREQRDLAEIEYNRMQTRMDSLAQKAVLAKADSLLKTKRIAGYLLINSKSFREGVVEFHSEQPINFLRLHPLEQSLQVTLVEERMRQEGITVFKIQELLRPIKIQELLLEGAHKREFRFMATYLAPILAVLFISIAIFTASGYVFNSIASEKSNHVVELLLSSASPWQLIAGKIVGLGLVGIVQILIWMALLAILVFARLMPAYDVVFLTPANAGLFLLYFLLGYLFFASIFIGIAPLSSAGQETHYVTQFLRLLAVVPLVLAILVLLAPNSMLVRFLSFIPFLTPTFMILRTPLGQPPVIDYYVSIAIMVVFIVLFMFFSAKIFRIANLTRRQDLSLRGILELLQAK